MIKATEEGGTGRVGKGGTGRDRGGKEEGEEWGVGGRGGALDMGSAPSPLETSSGSAPGWGNKFLEKV